MIMLQQESRHRVTMAASRTNGEGGIRTLGGCDPTLDFESSTIGHSVTSPDRRRTGLP